MALSIGDSSGKPRTGLDKCRGDERRGSKFAASISALEFSGLIIGIDPSGVWDVDARDSFQYARKFSKTIDPQDPQTTEAAMSGEASQHLGDKREKPSYEVESLKRELWMRVLGMKTETQSQSSAEAKTISAASGPNPPVTAH